MNINLFFIFYSFCVCRQLVSERQIYIDVPVDGFDFACIGRSVK